MQPDDPLRTNHEESAPLVSEHIHSAFSEEEEDEDHARQVASWKTLPWWKRPSPYWIIFGIPFGSFGYSAVLAPKTSLYTMLACRVHRPELAVNYYSLHPSLVPITNNLVETNTTGLLIPDVEFGSETAADAVSVLLPNSAYTESVIYTRRESDSQEKCAADPVVQATVAKLTAVFTTTMGILTCLTTGWWGSLSDRYGRRIVLFVSMFGLFMSDAIHIVTAWFIDILPGGYWFPLIASLAEGLCGSMLLALAMNNAYLTDTTDPSTRSRYFSLSLGFMFTGVAVGPIIGGLLMHSTGNLLSVFYFACTLHGLYSVIILSILPESLTRARSKSAHLRRSQEKANRASSDRAFGAFKSSAKFLTPLAIFLPERLPDANPLVRGRRDWSLFFIVIAYGLNTSIMGSIPYKFQYAAAQFHWTPEILNYFVSSVGVSRAAFLAAILPFIIKYLKPAPIQLPSTPDEPLQDTMSPPLRNDLSLPGSAASEQKPLPSRSPSFDLALARISVVVDAISFLGMAVVGTGALYTLSAVFGSLAAGFPPAVQALALDIYTNRRLENRGEVGKLLGALNMIQALTTQILSPAMYGIIYSSTVGFFPQAIMVVSMCSSLLALVSLSFVRFPPPSVAMPGDENGRSGRMEVPS